SVPGPASKSIITGAINFPFPTLRLTLAQENLSQFHDLDDWGFQQELEENYGRVVKLTGFSGYIDRHLFVFDPVALHHILVKDQDVYEEMPKFLCLDLLVFGEESSLPWGTIIANIAKTMMPAFSTLNLRGVVPLFYEVAERLDFNSISCRTSLELIGRTGIGYSFDPMLPGQEQTDRYARALRGLFVTAFKLQLFIPLLPILMNYCPRRCMAQEGGKLDGSEEGKDIMSLLVKGNATADAGMHLADDELVACLSMILFAATDTTSSSMNRMIHLLALNPEVQHKLREEVLTAPEHLDYDKIDALPYLDGFVREILRLYPPVPVMFREAMSDITLPLSTPIIGSDGTIMHTIAVPKGTSIYVGLAAANHDKSIWGEDALEFKPDRWTKGKADSVETKLPGIYGNTMTFLGGGRSCIGFKFAQLEMKVVVCVLLRSFSFSKPDSGIRWRKTGIMPSPYVNDEPKLPIVVERLRA
ncbi:cytochrome P450, partial [Mycena metata]